MSILGALQAGVSGLGAQSSAMGAIADNIANMNTIGYKNNNVSFSTLVTKQVSSSKYSSGGVQPHASQSIDTQGLLSSVSSTTSLAVSGQGYFVVNSTNIGDGTWAYTRAGDFLKDETGYLVNSGGYYAQAWSLMPWDGTESAATVEINGITYMKAYKNENGETVYINDNIVDQNNLRGINLSNIGGTATPTTQIAFGANLPSGSRIGETHSVSTLIYDSLGNPNNISLNYTKESANSWGLDTSIPSGAAAINLYTDDGLIYSSIGQMEFTEIPAEGSIIEINGKKFEFTNDPNVKSGEEITPGGNVAVSINQVNSVRDAIESFLTAIELNIRDAGRFTRDNNSIKVVQSLTGNALTIDCSGTLACVQSAAAIDKSSGLANGIFTVEAVDNKIKNCAYVDFDAPVVADGNSSIMIDGINFVFGAATNPPAANTFYLNDYPQYSPVQAVEALVKAITEAGVAEPDRFVASGKTLQIIPSSTGETIMVTNNIAGSNAHYITKGVDTANIPTTGIVNSFEYNEVEQLGSQIPAVMFNSDGTPKEINVQDMEIYWANGAQDMTGDVKLGDGVRIKINMGSENVSTGLTNLSGGFSTSYINQDGATFGSYAGVTVGDDGVVTAVFSNGETRPIAIIPLALFVNPNGMEALNNNVWIATTESGNPLLTKATTGGAGEIVSSSLESSTVDLATEFSNMIVVQRAYSAAGKIMTTADEMLQELTNLV
ncbi:MAG: flagellar hook-basal body complex protein [Alphaproteobacteria bacterium]|nr:flagellar hook-basal body complex protein [Alphaproteobacteria bacterium]